MIYKELEMCPLCHNVENIKRNAGLVECPFCGNFTCDAMANDLLTNCPDEFNDEQRLKVRYVVKKRYLENLNNNQNLGVENLTEIRIKEINENYQIPKFMDKILLVLEYILEQTTYFEEQIKLDINTIFPLFYCKHSMELKNILEFLNTNGYIKVVSGNALQGNYKGCKNNLINYKYNYELQKVSNASSNYNYICYGIALLFITNKGIEYIESKQKY